MAERPLECSQCKKSADVTYQEIVSGGATSFTACADCPILQQKLHGGAFCKEKEGKQAASGLCCGACGTTCDSVKMGNPLGCGACYEVFADILTQKNLPLHVGKSPTKQAKISPSSRIPALNEALGEALRKENYEQAAWLRDQIKAVMEKSDERKK